MRIAHIHTNQEWGGGETQVLALLRGLKTRGIDALLVADPRGPLFGRAHAAGIETEPLPRVLIQRGVLRLMQRWAPDLIHVHDSKGTGIGTAVGSRMRVPVVLTRRIASPLRRNHRSRRKYSADRLALIIAISETVKRVVADSDYPIDRIVVAPDGLELEDLERVQSDDAWRQRYGAERLVVGMGRLSRKKNWGLLVRTAERVRDGAGPDIHWVVAGAGPERRRLERLAESLGVSDRVHFPGFVQEATRLLKSADALFFPSLMEGASVTVREAMALGVPVVAVNAPGTVESLAGAGWLVGSEDADAGARAVRDALENVERRGAVCAQARDIALTRYGMDRMIEGTVSAYRVALG